MAICTTLHWAKVRRGVGHPCTPSLTFTTRHVDDFLTYLSLLPYLPGSARKLLTTCISRHLGPNHPRSSQSTVLKRGATQRGSAHMFCQRTLHYCIICAPYATASSADPADRRGQSGCIIWRGSHLLSICLPANRATY